MADKLNKTQARQGRTGQNMRYVLAASLLLGVVALIIVFVVIR